MRLSLAHYKQHVEVVALIPTSPACRADRRQAGSDHRRARSLVRQGPEASVNDTMRAALDQIDALGLREGHSCRVRRKLTNMAALAGGIGNSSVVQINSP